MSGIPHRQPSPEPRALGDTTFRYTAIDPTAQIRLLCIAPSGNPNATFALTFRIVLLERPGPYTAISYAWGDPYDTRLVSLEGHEFPITVNLWHALQSLRHPTEEVVVWADAISIHQQNIAERNQQVLQMASIFNKAAQVAVHIGPRTENSTAGLGLLARIAESPTDVLAILSFPERLIKLGALADILGRDYWKRLWVIQEIANANSLTLYCGADSLSWTAYSSGTLALYDYTIKMTISSDILPTSWYTTIIKHVISKFWKLNMPEEKRGRNLSTMLGTCGYMLCTDPRDKIYAVLGALNDAERSLVRIDYNLSVTEVYVQAAVCMIQRSKRLDVLLRTTHYPERAWVPERLPTWVPNWSCGLDEVPHNLESFGASGKASEAKYSLSQRNKRLAFSAIYVDEVDIHGPALHDTGGLEVLLVALASHDLVRSRFPDDEAAEEAFCSVLATGSFNPTERPEPSGWKRRVLCALAHGSRNYNVCFSSARRLESLYDANWNPEDSDQLHYIVMSAFSWCLSGRRLILTKNGLIGLARASADSGDIICVPLGCSMPVVLRKVPNRDEYTYVGDVCLNEYMDGRAVDELGNGTRQLQTFTVI